MTPHDDHPSTPPAENDEPTQVLPPAGEPTQVPPRTDEATRALRSAGEATQVLPSAGKSLPGLAPATEHTATVHLKGPADDLTVASTPTPLADDGPPPAAADYSATVLASHWIQRPEPDDNGTLPEEPPAGRALPGPEADRAEGSVLRFGPGVTAAVAHRTHRTLPVVAAPAAAPRRRLRRHALPALVVLLVLAFLAWQRLGPPVAVRAVAVEAEPAALGCGGTADIVGLVTTNGRPGTLSYRWVRSDGTASGVLREVVVRGRRQARLHLRWTFQGEGRRTARAELRILSPAHRPVAAHLTYACP